MRKRILPTLMIATLLTIPVIEMKAVKAMPGIIPVRQPDGSEVHIELKGDAFTKTAFSEDGYLLTTDEQGYYVFADIDEKGELVATGMRDLDVATRSASTNNMVLRMNHRELSGKIVERNETRMKVKMNNRGLMDTGFPAKGEQPSLVILVEFKNQKFSFDNPREYYTRLLNEEGFNEDKATGSARDFFVSNSQGIFRPRFDVYGPVTLPYDYSYYGKNDNYGNDMRPERMILDACDRADSEVDFSIYDCNNDGKVDNIYVFYAGYGESDGGGSDTIWPHSYDLTSYSYQKYYYDDVYVDHYACSNELQYRYKQKDGIGTFCHEFSHVLGLPDLYATMYTNSFTPGTWDTLDEGSYNNMSRTPPNYSSFERYALDWMEPLEAQAGEYTLQEIGESNEAILFNTENENEYYLLENRQKTGFDTFLPSHGMLVWHIDFDLTRWKNNIVNNESNHQRVDLVEADGILNLNTLTGDPFPGKKGITEFTCKTSPSLVSWNNKPLDFDVFDITETNDGLITLKLKTCEFAGVKEISYDSGLLITGRKVSSKDGSISVYDINSRFMGNVDTRGLVLNPGIYIAKKAGNSYKFIIR